MSDAQTILKMIESVDPNDTKTLDEIDARVWCWLNGATLKKPSKNMWKNFEEDYSTITYEIDNKEGCASSGWAGGTTHIKSIRKYTRSRDALKAIRPEGWLFDIEANLFELITEWVCWMKNSAEEAVEQTPSFKTEELAELHAIIQAIEWGRSHA